MKTETSRVMLQALTEANPRYTKLKNEKDQENCARTADATQWTAEFIMFPPVYLALQQYGNLVLGVVRIYSKQVEYFSQDCRDLEAGIRKAFNLPEDATHAPYYSDLNG
ncbi:hypothetical protein HAX54_050109 [Datura stramonium]|uniref:Rad21/Rec8-like protein N-terminal domain-containing protein n=1 Tax=Datura stramonium TaxID=4076 RepID=A0ABS8SWF3_DATST|nr:hypothetical protein [Datura stramonium]